MTVAGGAGKTARMALMQPLQQAKPAKIAGK